MNVQIERIAPTIFVRDLDRAKAFYEEVFGLEEQDRGETEVLLTAGGATELVLTRTDTPQPSEHTRASFTVPDLDAVLPVLRARGARFLDHDQPGLKTVDGVYDDGACKTAWTTDPEDNILCVCSVSHR